MPFPSTFPTLLNFDAALDVALAAAIVETQVSFPALGVPPRTAITIVAIDESTSGPPSFRHAGFRALEEHFSASLLKVAAMFAAFELRQSANNFALTAGDCSPNVLFADMSASFDGTIASAVPLISNDPAITPSMKAPKYRSIFDSQGLASGGCLISFTQSFSANIRGMIVNSSNPAAGACIQQLGYSWINGVLANGGLFNPTTEQGIWLAGTFIGALPVVRIPSLNDGPSAQAMTCFDMANLYALLFEKTTIDSRSPDSICDEMLALLADATVGADPSWLTAGVRPGVTGLSSDFSVTHTKIGLGPLNAGGDVASEATIVQHNPTGKKFIVVWQNALNLITMLNGVSFLVEKTIKHFLGIP
jgi:hypothetical protein